MNVNPRKLAVALFVLLGMVLGGAATMRAGLGLFGLIVGGSMAFAGLAGIIVASGAVGRMFTNWLEDLT